MECSLGEIKYNMNLANPIEILGTEETDTKTALYSKNSVKIDL